MQDNVDGIMSRLAAQRPELDISSIAVGGRIGRVALHLSKIRDAVFSPHKINAGESDVLAALWREGPPYELSPGGLLASVTISSGGMTGRVDRLERAGLVARRPDPDDRRGVLVRLTDTGAQLTGELVNSYLTEQKRFVSVLTPGELERLERLLRKLTAAAEHSAPDGHRSRAVSAPAPALRHRKAVRRSTSHADTR